MANQVVQKPVKQQINNVPKANQESVEPVVEGEKQSILKKWWLWTIVGVVIVGLLLWIIF